MGNKQTLTETKCVQSTKHKEHIIKINIKIKGHIDDNLVIDAVYMKQEKIKNIFQQTIKYLNHKYCPKKLKIEWITDGFFGEEVSSLSYKMHNFMVSPITMYERNDIIKRGLTFVVMPYYEHEVISSSITCPFMNKVKSMDPLKCRIYYAMKEKYEWNAENLIHLNEFVHFLDEYRSKPKCKYNDDCKAFVRLENGGNEIDDQC
eukprot:370603_1